MKTLSSITFFLFAIIFSAGAQSFTAEQYPKMIVKTVTEKFPETEDIDWRMKNNLYEVEIDGPADKNTWMRFDHSGNLLAQKEHISPAYLPASVSDLVVQKFAGYKTVNTEKMQTEGKTYYQVSLKGRGGKSENLVFTEKGELTNEILFWN